jgi:hypothetical protein
MRRRIKPTLAVSFCTFLNLGGDPVWSLFVTGKRTMIGEETLMNIIRAADPNDGDDVAIRKLLVSALRDIGADLTELLHHPAAGSRLTLVNLGPNRSGRS